ncbi:MAG: hypothetical protein K2N32_01720, partial [Clostridia bacterium]|nr:hypothetical protein [Clostridia bacterium]
MPKTSADFRGYNNGLDVVVTIGGRQWTATYLSANSSGDPILTFWVATYDGVYSRWHSQEVNRSGDYPNNMYGTSEIRAVALNNGGGYAATYNATSLTYVNQDENNDWAIYTMDSVSGSLTSFIEVPDNMSWQHNQSAKDSAGQSYNYNNDALNSGMGSFYDDDHCYESKTGYANWANDKVWLPSIAETGENNESGIWMVSKNQRASDTHTWTRSGYYNNYYRSFRHLSSGTGESYGNISAVAWGRPAFHLNLKKAAERAENLKTDQPTNVTLEYTGRALTLADVSAEHKSWYDSAKISLEYPAGGMKDAGTYTVTANIKEDFISNHEFSGEPDTSKGETPTTRKFNFTITKKKIGVDLTLDPSGKPAAALKTAELCGGDSTENGRAPNLGFNYTSSNGYNSDTLPTAVGTYTATVKILNTDCNYVLDNTYTINFTINKTDVPKPTISGQASKQYTGEEITFTMTGGDNAGINITLPDGMTRDVNTLRAKNAGKYKVVVTLADNGVATQWPGGSTSAIELEYEIMKKPLGITITCDASNFEWNVGDRPTVTIVGDSHPDDSTELYIYYIDNNIGTSIKYDNINNDKVIEGKTRTIKMPGDIAQGSYTICVELYGDRKDNANYSLAVAKTAVFTVKGNSVTVDDSVINWKYNNTEVGNPTDTLVLVYNGNAYRFSVDESVLASHGAKIDIGKGTNGYDGNISETNAGSSLYSVTVYLTNLDSNYESYNAQYTLYYRIDKAKYDLSGLSWPSVSTLEYNGRAQGMTLQGTLP